MQLTKAQVQTAAQGLMRLGTHKLPFALAMRVASARIVVCALAAAFEDTKRAQTEVLAERNADGSFAAALDARGQPSFKLSPENALQLGMHLETIGKEMVDVDVKPFRAKEFAAGGLHVEPEALAAVLPLFVDDDAPADA